MNNTAIHILFLILIASVLTTALFGFSAMQSPGHSMAGCFGSAPGATCSMLSPIEHFAAHLRAFQNVSAAVVQEALLLAALLLLVLIRFSLALKKGADLRRGHITRREDNSVPPQRIQFSRWIALHEKRDPSFACAVNG